MRAPLLALALATLPVTATAQTSAMPEIPAAIRPHVPQNLRGYFVVFLTTPERPHAMSGALFLQHQAYIRRQFEAGVYHVAGPFTDSGHVRGMLVLSAASLEEATRIARGDPAVTAGVFAIEVHPAMFPNLSAVRAEYLPAQP